MIKGTQFMSSCKINLFQDVMTKFLPKCRVMGRGVFRFVTKRIH